ncbi:MAG TPA: ribosomal-processing cysteine protease Prp [Candidatus Cybelea sp.]|jgi:hypothetical protein|nr:ribosomal-processing cysteine protease Prp [Candidatus Cybelea sp.]
MLEVTFFRDEHGRHAGVQALGHADFAEHGADIVCAAVSAILQAARLGLEHYAAGEIVAMQEPGRLRVVLNEGCRDRESLAALLTAAELSVTQVARRFPEHVSVAHERIVPKAETRRPDSGN